MLGQDLLSSLRARGWEVWAPAHAEVDVTDPASVGQVASRQADWCFNCAAYTAVDRAETEVREATELNALAPGYLAKACAASGARLMHVSTDFVFDGTSSLSYREDSPTHPLGVYGKTKLEGEMGALANPLSVVARTSWLYGPGRGSFPKTMIRAWLAGKKLRVVGDQTGCPTYTADLARVMCDLAVAGPEGGVYHACGPDAVSWHELAVRAIREYVREFGGEEPQIEEIRTEDWPTPAKRPAYSVLSCEKTRSMGIEPMRPLDEALGDFVLKCDWKPPAYGP